MITEMMKSMKPAASRSISRTRDGGDSRLEDIEEVYRSEDYKSYIKRMPKHRRGQRDPKTPDRKASMSSGAWGEKVSQWRGELERWNKSREDTSLTRIKDTNVKNDLVGQFFMSLTFAWSRTIDFKLQQPQLACADLKRGLSYFVMVSKISFCVFLRFTS